jgi:hypothetical protein
MKKLTSRKFLSMIGGVILVLVLDALSVPSGVIVWVVGLIGGWIGIEGGLDALAILKGIKHK